MDSGKELPNCCVVFGARGIPIKDEREIYPMAGKEHPASHRPGMKTWKVGIPALGKSAHSEGEWHKGNEVA
jgi:hypothetical protein